MEKKLDSIQKHIDSEVKSASDAGSERITSLIATIEENMELAEQAIGNAYETVNSTKEETADGK